MKSLRGQLAQRTETRVAQKVQRLTEENQKLQGQLASVRTAASEQVKRGRQDGDRDKVCASASWCVV